MPIPLLILALDFGGTKLTAALFTAEDSTQSRQDAKTQEESGLAQNSTPGRNDANTPEEISLVSLRLRALALNVLRRVVTPADADAAYELAAMLALAREALAGRVPAAVGVSFGGPVDFAAGVVRRSDHVRGWDNFPLRARLAAEFGCPVAVDNDANVAALGEHRFGAGRGVADLLYVTVSTGVGGGWILGGRPWRGHEGLAGEIGHTVADPAGPLCLCGQRGCVERLASGPYMAADYVQGAQAQGSRGAGQQGAQAQGSRGAGQQGGRDPGPEARSSLEPGPWNLAPALTGRDVAERAAAGDEAARAILVRGAWALGVGLGNAANLINPQRFILGGGVTKAGEAWWVEVRRAAAATAVAGMTFDVIPAALGDDAPLWGALVLAAEMAR